MKIKIYDTAQDFLNENEKLLLEKEAVTQLILHNAFMNREKKRDSEVLFGRVEGDNEKVKLIFVNAQPFNLLIHSLEDDALNGVEFLADYLRKNDVTLRGVNANKLICDRFIEYYSQKTRCTFEEHLAMDIMEIRELNKDVSLPKGNFRVATLDDKELLKDWHVKFTKDALDEDISPSDFTDRFDKRITDKSTYIFEDENNTPRAMIVVTRKLVNGVAVSFVYSDRECRGKGYGLAVTYNLSKEYLNRGNDFCCLFVDKKNPISNAVYKKVGYKILEDNYDYRIIK